MFKAFIGALVAVLMLISVGQSTLAGYNLSIGYVNDNEVNCRHDPGIEHEIFIVLYTGSPVHIVQMDTVHADDYDWQMVILPDHNGQAHGPSCWIANDFITEGDPALIDFDYSGAPEADKPTLPIPEGMPPANYVAWSATGPSTPIEEYNVKVVSSQPQPVTGLPETGTGPDSHQPSLTPSQIEAIVSGFISTMLLGGAIYATSRNKSSQRAARVSNTMGYAVRRTPYGVDFSEEGGER